MLARPRSPPPFVAALETLQDKERWREGREQLYSMWLTGAPEGVVEEIRREMGVHDFDMCSRAARVVTAHYARHETLCARSQGSIRSRTSCTCSRSRVSPSSSPRRRRSRPRTHGSR